MRARRRSAGRLQSLLELRQDRPTGRCELIWRRPDRSARRRTGGRASGSRWSRIGRSAARAACPSRIAAKIALCSCEDVPQAPSPRRSSAIVRAASFRRRCARATRACDASKYWLLAACAIARWKAKSASSRWISKSVAASMSDSAVSISAIAAALRRPARQARRGRLDADPELVAALDVGDRLDPARSRAGPSAPRGRRSPRPGANR